MTSRAKFDAWWGSIGSELEHIRPPAPHGLSRRLLGFIHVDSGTIRIADPCNGDDGEGAIVISTGGDGLYPVWGTFHEGELCEVMFGCQYFWCMPDFSCSPLDPYEEDDLAHLSDATGIVDYAESGEPHEYTTDQIAAARRHIEEYDAHAEKLRADQIASVRASRRRLESLGGI
jgi:hypothetical protein